MEQPRSVEDAVVVLQSDSEPAYARIAALRYAIKRDAVHENTHSFVMILNFAHFRYLRTFVTTSTNKFNRKTVSKVNRLITETVTRLFNPSHNPNNDRN